MRRSGLIAALLALLALQTGCKEEPPPANLIQPGRPFFYEAEFAQTPTLAARQHQVVVFDLEPTGAGQATADDVSRHELEAGAYRFCIEDGDPYFHHLSVEDADGRRVVDVDAPGGCHDVQLEAGTYRLRLRHSGVAIGGPHRLAFLHRLKANPRLVGDGGVPRVGWWALAPNDPTGKLRPGRLHAQPPPRPVGTNPNFYQAAEPIVADFSSQQIDESALFSFLNLGGSLDQPVPLLRSGPYKLDLTVFSQMEASATFIANTVEGLNKFNEFPLQVVQLGNQKVQFQEKPTFFPYTNFFIDVDDVIKWDNKPQNLPDLTAQVLFRISFVGDPDYGQNVPAEGEVALYQECNYGGPVTIFAVDTPDLSALSSSSVTLDRTTASVRFGPGAAVVLHPETAYGGTGTTIAGDTPCLDGTPIGRGTRSFQIKPVLPIFVASSSCENCNLSGLDLTGVSVTGADLRGANLSGTTLNRTSLHAARSLVGTDFSGASVTCSDFSGTDAGVVDLTQTELFTATFAPDISSCRSNFSSTRVDDAHLNPAVLRLLNLTNATIGLSAPLAGWDLRGALWSGATVVGVLSFPGAHFEGASLEGMSLQGANFKEAVLQGASLRGANLTGAQVDQAQMQDAGFQGATLIDVTGLSSAALTGSDFTGATFGGTGFAQASFEKVILDGATFRPGTDLSEARFNDSSMQQVDLHGVQLYGANFTHTNLTNSNLAGALLSNNPDAGVEIPADFTGAHLKNVNLSSAQIQGTVFQFASLYGNFNTFNNGPPVFPCETDTTKCGTTPVTGFTCSCATVVGASMTRTDFSSAFLYGVDFRTSNTVINGVDFSGAILVGANFDGAKFDVDPNQGGAQPMFAGAFLQGTNLGTATLDTTSFLNAYVDFEPGGNQLQVVLGPNYTSWNGWEAPGQPVCVQVDYTGFITHVPVTTGNTECPDGLQHPGGCGSTPPRPNPNPNWKSPIAIDQASPPGYYSNNATYTDANQDAGCNSNTANFDW